MTSSSGVGGAPVTATTACCEALYGVQDDAETCGRPGARYSFIGCVHEHVDRLYVCSVCEARGIGCADCHDAGHVCWMRVFPLTENTADA